MNKMNRYLFFFFCLPSIVSFLKFKNRFVGGVYRWGGAAWLDVHCRMDTYVCELEGDLPSAYMELFYESVGGPILPKKKTN
jgi:hypothetical protein